MERTYTIQQKIDIELLTDRGVGDFEISRVTNLPYHVIRPITTKYWKNKMQLKLK